MSSRHGEPLGPSPGAIVTICWVFFFSFFLSFFFFFCIFLLSNSSCIYVFCLCLNFFVVAVFGRTVWIVTENLAHLHVLRLLTYLDLWLSSYFMGFPFDSDGKESACNVGDLGSIPGLGRSPGEGRGYLLQCSCLKNTMDRGTRQATVHGVTESRTWLSAFISPYFIHKPLLILLG